MTFPRPAARRAPAIAVCLLAFPPAHALAQDTAARDTFRQTVVVTAAASPVELGSTTRTLTVMTREQIAALPVHSVADVLRMVSAVDVRARGERGVQTDFALRGATLGQALVLVDGVRLNDPQSGHHNGDVPVPLEDVERIEILHGAGSALFGADAFGGTVNVITRRGASKPGLLAQGGTFGLSAGSGQAGVERGALSQTVAVSAERSSGFMYDRDFESVLARSRTALGRTAVSLAFLRKEFGANGFYGNAPSREWTNQTLLTVDRSFAERAGWSAAATASYRTHGDRFLFNQTTPQLFNNLHRTHSAIGGIAVTRRFPAAASLTLGVEGGGDWIRSTNLGDHDLGRVSGFGEWRQGLGTRAHLDAAVRVDRYSEFGTAWNPSIGVGWWPSDVVRLRTSVGRAFRVPTFTERYYTDPANWARPEVGPETSWSGEAGADVFLPSAWVVQATVFGRSDADVIDWQRASVAERWRTYNVRDVSTRGVEVALRRSFPNGALAHVSYTGLVVDAASVTQLSKYVLDYAPRSLAAAAIVPMPGGVRLAPRAEYRRRSRTTGRQDYVLLDARVSRALGRTLEVRVEGTNLFDVSYQEIAGVQMPGAAMSVSLAIGAR
jgi:iron complex outermembrane receptor protein